MPGALELSKDTGSFLQENPTGTPLQNMARAEIDLDNGSYSVVKGGSHARGIDVCPEGAELADTCLCASTCPYQYQAVRRCDYC